MESSSGGYRIDGQGKQQFLCRCSRCLYVDPSGCWWGSKTTVRRHESMDEESGHNTTTAIPSSSSGRGEKRKRQRVVPNALIPPLSSSKTSNTMAPVPPSSAISNTSSGLSSPNYLWSPVNNQTSQPPFPSHQPATPNQIQETPPTITTTTTTTSDTTASRENYSAFNPSQHPGHQGHAGYAVEMSGSGSSGIGSTTHGQSIYHTQHASSSNASSRAASRASVEDDTAAGALASLAGSSSTITNVTATTAYGKGKQHVDSSSSSSAFGKNTSKSSSKSSSSQQQQQQQQQRLQHQQAQFQYHQKHQSQQHHHHHHHQMASSPAVRKHLPVMMPLRAMARFSDTQVTLGSKAANDPSEDAWFSFDSESGRVVGVVEGLGGGSVASHVAKTLPSVWNTVAAAAPAAPATATTTTATDNPSDVNPPHDGVNDDDDEGDSGTGLDDCDTMRRAFAAMDESVLEKTNALLNPLDRLRFATQAACAVSLHVSDSHLIFGNLGTTQAVLAVESGPGIFHPFPVTRPHRPSDPREMARLRSRASSSDQSSDQLSTSASTSTTTPSLCSPVPPSLPHNSSTARSSSNPALMALLGDPVVITDSERVPLSPWGTNPPGPFLPTPPSTQLYVKGCLATSRAFGALHLKHSAYSNMYNDSRAFMTSPTTPSTTSSTSTPASSVSSSHPSFVPLWKWDKARTTAPASNPLPNISPLPPPAYIDAEPELVVLKRTQAQIFAILASSGFWNALSPDNAVWTAHALLTQATVAGMNPSQSRAWAATMLVEHAASLCLAPGADLSSINPDNGGGSAGSAGSSRGDVGMSGTTAAASSSTSTTTATPASTSNKRRAFHDDMTVAIVWLTQPTLHSLPSTPAGAPPLPSSAPPSS